MKYSTSIQTEYRSIEAMFYKLAAPIFLAVVAILQSLLNYYWHDRGTVTYKITRIVLTCFIFIAAGTTIVVNIQDYYDNQEQRESLKNAEKERVQMGMKLNAKGDEIIDLQKKLINKQEAMLKQNGIDVFNIKEP